MVEGQGGGISERDTKFLLRTMSTRMKEVEGNTLPTLDANNTGQAAGRILGKALGHVRKEARLAHNANESQGTSDKCED